MRAGDRRFAAARGRGLPTWAVAVWLAAAATCAGAQDLRGAEIVRGIEVRPRGGLPVEESYLLAHVGSAVGEPLEPEGVARDVRTLLDTGHYTYLDTRVEPLDDGVRLVFVAESRHRVAERPDVTGNRGMSRAKIRELLDLQPGAFVDEPRLAAATARVRAEYHRRRYWDARIETELTPVAGSPDAATVAVRVTEGPRYRVPLIRFHGNRALSDARLRRYSGQSPRWNPAGWFTTRRLDEFDLELLRSDVRAQYASLGHLDATISPPRVVQADGVRQIEFDVAEGPRYRVGQVLLEGVSLFPEGALRDRTGLSTGAVASWDAIEQGAKALRDHYGANGYVDTDVRTALVPDPERPGHVTVLYRVQEGELAYVRNISIRGNTRTRDKVIRREIGLNPGDILDVVQADLSEQRLRHLGYFESVRSYDLPTADGLRRDLVYEVEEKPTGQFMIGAGFSSVDRVLGFMELSQSNFDLFNWGRFTGGGQKARIGVQASSRASDFELSFVEPWFLDQRLSLNLGAFLRHRSYSEFDERRAGGSVGLSRHVPWVGRMGLTYTLQQVRLSDVLEGDFRYLDEPDRLYRYTDEDDRYMQGSLRLNWTYDTRNHLLVPTRGSLATASATLYGEALGGGADLYELSARARHYVPTFYGHVVSFYARGDVIDAWGGDEVPIGNRFFLGGGRNVRGFRYRAVGPKVQSVEAEPGSRSYRPVGGQTLLQGSVEYTIPVTQFFRLAAFWDIGNVYDKSFDADFGEFASSVGGGFRFDFPGFPIRLDYAIPLERDDEYSRRQLWVFWVGFD